MNEPEIIWDLPDDPDGNVVHIAEHGITQDEVADVLSDPSNETTHSRSSGNWITFGWTQTDRHLAVVWEHVLDNPWTVYPITAYETPPKRRARR